LVTCANRTSGRRVMTGCVEPTPAGT
jgi:hypothetical protein